jgi:hypothetical protein
LLLSGHCVCGSWGCSGAYLVEKRLQRSFVECLRKNMVVVDEMEHAVQYILQSDLNEYTLNPEYRK